MSAKTTSKLTYLWFLLDFNLEDYLRESAIKALNEESHELLSAYSGRRKKGKREFEINCISKKSFLVISVVISVCLDILSLSLKTS